MTFEEYKKSDEGQLVFKQIKLRNSRIQRISIVFLFVLGLIWISSVLFEILSENSDNNVLTWIGIAVMLIALMGINFFALFLRSRSKKSASLLSKAISLYWLEHPVPWESFLRDGEMILAVDYRYLLDPRRRKNAPLEGLILSANDSAFSLPMSEWEGLLDRCVPVFLLVSLLPFLNRRKELGGDVTTLNFIVRMNGKNVSRKNCSYLIRNGKVLRSAREAFRIAQEIGNGI